jgi:hypothetical protein
VKQKPAGAKELVADISAWIRGNFRDGESGIVYALTRKDTESLAEVNAAIGIYRMLVWQAGYRLSVAAAAGLLASQEDCNRQETGSSA